MYFSTFLEASTLRGSFICWVLFPPPDDKKATTHHSLAMKVGLCLTPTRVVVSSVLWKPTTALSPFLSPQSGSEWRSLFDPYLRNCPPVLWKSTTALSLFPSPQSGSERRSLFDSYLRNCPPSADETYSSPGSIPLAAVCASGDHYEIMDLPSML